MKLLLLTLSLVLVSCGPGKTGGSAAPTAPVEIADASFLNKFEAINGQGLHTINELDFSEVKFGEQLDNQLGQICDGSYGNSGTVNGAEMGKMIVTGDEKSGTIQIGHTKYVGASNPICRGISKEAYTYTIKEDILTLCMVNYNFCADYAVVK